jgi:peptide deformylase
MSVLPLVIAPDERLKRVSEKIPAITPEIRKLAADMLETMYANQGIGLAAVQVGVHKRMIVVDVGHGGSRYAEEGAAPGKSNPFVLINPEIVELSGEVELVEEGCLSVPGLWHKTPRYPRAKAKGLQLDGSEVIIEGEGLLAQALQHECDHLEGKLYLDRLLTEERKLAFANLRQQSWFLN